MGLAFSHKIPFAKPAGPSALNEPDPDYKILGADIYDGKLYVKLRNNPAFRGGSLDTPDNRSSIVLEVSMVDGSEVSRQVVTYSHFGNHGLSFARAYGVSGRPVVPFMTNGGKGIYYRHGTTDAFISLINVFPSTGTSAYVYNLFIGKTFQHFVYQIQQMQNVFFPHLLEKLFFLVIERRLNVIPPRYDLNLMEVRYAFIRNGDWDRAGDQVIYNPVPTDNVDSDVMLLANLSSFAFDGQNTGRTPTGPNPTDPSEYSLAMAVIYETQAMNLIQTPRAFSGGPYTQYYDLDSRVQSATRFQAERQPTQFIIQDPRDRDAVIITNGAGAIQSSETQDVPSGFKALAWGNVTIGGVATDRLIAITDTEIYFYGGSPPPDLMPSITATVNPISVRVGQTLSPVTLPEATGGDGPLTYALTPVLPAGLEVDLDTRVLSGSPSAAQARTQYTWTARDRDGDVATVQFFLTVTPNLVPAFADDAEIPDLALTKDVRPSIPLFPRATGGDGDLTYTLTPERPAGLTLFNNAQGVTGLGGTPTAAFSRTLFTYTVTDEDGDSDSLTFYISVTDPSRPADRLPSFSQGASIAEIVATRDSLVSDVVFPVATGGDGPLTYALSPALPAGMMFNPATRVFGGTPSVTFARRQFTYTARDTDGDVATLQFFLTVNAPTILQPNPPRPSPNPAPSPAPSAQSVRQLFTLTEFMETFHVVIADVSGNITTQVALDIRMIRQSASFFESQRFGIFDLDTQRSEVLVVPEWTVPGVTIANHYLILNDTGMSGSGSVPARLADASVALSIDRVDTVGNDFRQVFVCEALDIP